MDELTNRTKKKIVDFPLSLIGIELRWIPYQKLFPVTGRASDRSHDPLPFGFPLVGSRIQGWGWGVDWRWAARRSWLAGEEGRRIPERSWGGGDRRGVGEAEAGRRKKVGGGPYLIRVTAVTM
jgi:hypothetical protein